MKKILTLVTTLLLIVQPPALYAVDNDHRDKQGMCNTEEKDGGLGKGDMDMMKQKKRSS